MELNFSQKCYLTFVFLSVWIFSVFLQNTLFLHGDVIWLTHAASFILDGGTYSKNFFEIAPPSNLLLYIPAAFLNKISTLSIISSLLIYLFILGLLSLAICYHLIKKIFTTHDILLASAFFISLEVVFFILPIYIFGQKEHIFLMFTMPYILLMVCRIQNRPINRNTAILIGFFSSFGIAMKPYFLFFPLFLEIYYYITANKKTLKPHQKWTLCFRPETAIIFCAIIIHMMIVYFFFNDYLTVIVPYAIRWNYASLGTPWTLLLIGTIPFIFLYTGLFFIIQYQSNPYKKLTSVLILALAASVLSYLTQQTNFSYRMYPNDAFDLLLIVLLLGLSISSKLQNKLLYSIISFLIAHFIIKSYPLLHYSSALFIAFFTLLFFIIFYFKSSSVLKLTIMSLAMIVGGLGIEYLTGSSLKYFLLLYIGFLSSLFILLNYNTYCAQSKSTHSIRKNMLYDSTCLLSVFLFLAVPFSKVVLTYQNRLISDADTKTFITWIDKHALHQSIYFLSTYIPAVDYCRETKTVMRFPFLWMLPGMIKEEQHGKTPIKDKHFITQMVADDIHHKKPYLVFVDTSYLKPFLYSYQEMKPIQFDFLPFFLTNEDFKREWTHYQYLTTVNLVHTKRNFIVYQRKNLDEGEIDARKSS